MLFHYSFMFKMLCVILLNHKNKIVVCGILYSNRMRAVTTNTFIHHTTEYVSAPNTQVRCETSDIDKTPNHINIQFYFVVRPFTQSSVGVIYQLTFLDGPLFSIGFSSIIFFLTFRFSTFFSLNFKQTKPQT